MIVRRHALNVYDDRIPCRDLRARDDRYVRLSVIGGDHTVDVRERRDWRRCRRRGAATCVRNGDDTAGENRKRRFERKLTPRDRVLLLGPILHTRPLF